MSLRSIPGGGGGLGIPGGPGFVGDVNVQQIRGIVVVATTGVGGMMPVAGDVQSGNPNSGSSPVKIGAVAIATPVPTVVAGTFSHVITDLSRRLRTLPEGDAADNDPATVLNPVKVGAVADAALSIVQDGDQVHFVTDLYRRHIVLPEGDTPDDAVATTRNPVKVGAVADEVLSTVTNGDMVTLITDLYRQLRVVTAGYSTLLDAVRVSVLNTIADDRDPAHQTWADVTDLAANTYYYPSAAGHEVGNRDNLGFQVELVDGTLTLEASNDGTVWDPVTANLVDGATGTNGTTSYGGAAVTATYTLSWEKCEFRYLRFVWVTPDGSNDLEIHTYTRAH